MSNWPRNVGHASGNTRVSDMPFPEAFTRPAVTAAAKPAPLGPPVRVKVKWFNADGSLTDCLTQDVHRGRELHALLAGWSDRELMAEIAIEPIQDAPDRAAVARFVARSWRDAIRQDGIQPLNFLAATVLDKVLAAFDGETDPAALGITEDEDWPFGNAPEAPRVVVEFPADCTDTQIEAFKQAWAARDGGPVEYRRTGSEDD